MLEKFCDYSHAPNTDSCRGSVTEKQPISVAFTAEGSVLRAFAQGSGDYASTLDCWRRIAAALRERNPVGLLLIDETAGEPLSENEWLALVRAMSGEGLERVRIAHVKPFGLQRIEYCELFAREAGIEARVFTNEKEASVWLRYG
jgi:hypothetical protein